MQYDSRGRSSARRLRPADPAKSAERDRRASNGQDMARPYTTTHFFRRIPATLLARYFESRRVLTDSKKRGAKKGKAGGDFGGG